MNNQIQTLENTSITSTTDMILDHKAMVQMQALAEMMAQGKTTVPKHLQGCPADCMAIVMQAAQWKMNPFSVAQKTHLVNGTLGYEAQLVNAVITSSKAIKGRFHFRYGGDDWSNKGSARDCWVQVGALLKGEEDIQWGEPLYTSTVITKNSPLWSSAPKQQAAYLATKYWARLFAPQVILGVYSSDELEPQPAKEKVINNHVETTTQSNVLNNILSSEPDEIPIDELVYKEYLALINATNSQDELATIGAKMSNLLSDNFITEMQRDELAKAWSSKKRDLAMIDPSTGEIDPANH